MKDNSVIIETIGLKKHYKGHAIKALDGVDLQLKRGEVVVIIGPSGSGKSTYLRSLNLLEMPTEGSIIFNDDELSDTTVKLDSTAAKLIADAKAKLDQYSQLEFGADIYKAMKDLESEKKAKAYLSEEEELATTAKIDELTAQLKELEGL